MSAPVQLKSFGAIDVQLSQPPWSGRVRAPLFGKEVGVITPVLARPVIVVQSLT